MPEYKWKRCQECGAASEDYQKSEEHQTDFCMPHRQASRERVRCSKCSRGTITTMTPQEWDRNQATIRAKKRDLFIGACLTAYNESYTANIKTAGLIMDDLYGQIPEGE